MAQAAVADGELGRAQALHDHLEDAGAGQGLAGKEPLDAFDAVSFLIEKPGAYTVVFNGEELCKKSSRHILDAGIVQVPEGRQLFTDMTVLENLQMGAFSKETKEHFQENLQKCYQWFPKLEERARQAAGTLSGGEQQMVAVARALIGMPKLLILDEPSLGLAPNIVDDILNVAKTLAKESNISVLLVEQDITKALAAADRGYVIENGRVALSGSAEELAANEHVKKAYLGI